NLTFKMEGLLSELDYFEPHVMQLSVTGEYDRVFGTGQTIVQGGPLEFFVRGADGLYLDLNNSKLEIKLKITLENGNDIPGDAQVGPLNDILNALFMTMEMEMGGVLVTDPNTKYSYRAIVENLINYNKLIAETRLVAEGWRKDTASQCQVTDPTGANQGLTARAAWFTRSRVVTLIGRPHLDLFHQEKLIPANVDLKLKLIPNTSDFLLKTAAPVDVDHPQINYKVQIMSARLYIRTKEISPSLILAQEKLLQTTNYSIPFNKIITKTLTIPMGTSQMEFDNIYQGKLPDLVILGMISDANMSGGYQRNPFHFQNFGVNYLCMQANGEQIPRLAYQPNFTNRDYIRSYFGVLEALGFDIGPNCWDLTPEEWANGFNIYAFKITPGPIGTVRTPSR
ncbi:MAG: hypothetical protein FD143_3570, partial [Ignavibacteria bacterium]